ncbi:GH23882 [Drosophila grimshawi]|uniref:GH23882 n=2 Tax=Drosophila grimshawi TaxID=7222 RepID=B4JTG4_DROGR|nr:GH23882 [Drosophila grimshawi]
MSLMLQQKHMSDALLLKCPLHQLQLQKIVGFRPPLDYLSERNLIYAPPIASNFKDRDRRSGNYRLGVDNADDEQQPASEVCWRSCNEDPDCIAYVHLLDTNECYGYSYFERNARYLAIADELPLVADAEAMFYEKSCLRVPEACKGRRWALTKIPGNSLMYHGKKTISTLVTRRECAERCFFETQFKCLSASFAPSYRNNRERFRNGEHSQMPRLTLGRCTLSDKDKSIQPDAFRAAPYDEEYMENQCYERPMENDNCSYELYANSSFIYAEAKYLGLTQKECQALCTRESKFYCQGISFYYLNQLTRSECLLHSEDIVSLGPRSLKLRDNSIYMRRVKCLDVKVFCTRDEMSIRYMPKDWFTGRMYASMHSKDCQVSGSGNESLLLRLEIGSEPKENRCGILRAYEMTHSYHRTFISALVVIQNNANVQTQGDRLIKVGCILNNATAMLGQNAGDSNTDASEQVPSAIALESSVEYAKHMFPVEGVVHYNSSTADPYPQPRITLQIVDHTQQHETNDVQIGQNLELQIVAEYSADQFGEHLELQLAPLPDFRATSLVAKSQDNQNYVLLIDERGCPTDASVFPALERVRTQSRNMLRSRFHAFKFSGTANVSFDVKIRFCVQRCAPTNCLSSSEGLWHRRKRRQLERPERQLEQVRVQNPVYISTVMDVQQDSALNATASQMELPLNYNLHVHGPDQTNGNSFLYGERGVLLIAGIDDQLHLDNICINQSLLIALFILWLICQVALLFGCGMVLQRYRRLAKLEEERRRLHEEYLEARRVHWADQGGYTL